MRRFAVFSLLVTAIAAAPAAALASHAAVNDGVLVVKNGQAPSGTPVVILKNFTGSVIGQTTDQSRIVIDTGPKGLPPEVTGATQVPLRNPDATPSAQAWSSPDGFKFRVVGATRAVVLIYGSTVNLVAVGTGTVVLSGMPDTPVGDGRYSINGNPLVSMPGQPTKQLIIGDDS